MNEFTKEELQSIRQSLWRTQTNVVSCVGEKMINGTDRILLNKIQSMIDKYCEHEKVVPNYGPNTECTKCREIW